LKIAKVPSEFEKIKEKERKKECSTTLVRDILCNRERKITGSELVQQLVISVVVSRIGLWTS